MSRLRYPFTEVSARCRLCGAEGLTASSEHALGGRLIDWRRSHAPVCPEWPRWAEKKGLRLDERGALLYPNETGPYEPRIRPKTDEPDADADEPTADANATLDAPTLAPHEPLDAAAPDTLAPAGLEARSADADIDREALAQLDPQDAADADALAPAGREEWAEREVGGRAGRGRRGALWVVPSAADTADLGEARDVADAGAEGDWPEPLPLPLGVGPASNRANSAKSAKSVNAGNTSEGVSGEGDSEGEPHTSRDGHPSHAHGVHGSAGRRARPRPTAREVDLMQVPVEHLRQAELF